ncbi:MAG: N-6 DNA methylase [Sulfurovum sp.]
MNLQDYTNFINKNSQNSTEHTFRTPLENLLNELKLDDLIEVIHEAKKELDEDGTPDFKVIKSDDSSFKKLIGYIECKKLDYDLNKLVTSTQIAKYNKTSQNILITNYTEFILLNDGKITLKAHINDEISIINIINRFFQYEYALIKTSKKVIEVLSTQSFYLSTTLRDYIKEDKNSISKFYKKFNSLFKEFGNSINYHYSLDEFCDIYAQSLVYGLFIARLDGAVFNELEKNPMMNIPEYYTLLIEFLDSGYQWFKRPLKVEMVISSITKNLNLIDIEHIERNEQTSKDELIIYLYEVFLKEYDLLRATENRKESGVYYTPQRVTKFIVTAVSDILESKFDLKDRFLDKDIKILDFATGTGTFLANIFDELLLKADDELYHERIKDKIVNDIFGFELLFTPYIVAHTNLIRKLKAKNIELNEDERVGVYLTNTLDLSQHSISNFLPFLEEETLKAQEIKNRDDVLIVVGNPPYNSNSKDKSEKIALLLEDYKIGLNEKNIKPLNDDYIKFIRFAQFKIDKAGFGVVGVITNNSFLDGLVHRKMRESLLKSFDEIYIINLHGNSIKKEGDKNVFDIMVGVSISIFVKHKKPLKEKKLYYYSTLENKLISREEKLNFLEQNSLESINWKELEVKEPNWFFVYKNNENIEEYNEFMSITDIFNVYSAGIVTSKDNIAIQYTKKNLDTIKDEFITKNENELREKYNLQKESKDWQLLKAIKSFDKYNPQKISYRPYDIRYTNYSKGFIGRDRFEIMQHFLNNENLGLVFRKQGVKNNYNYFYVSNYLISDGLIRTDNKGTESITPLYTYHKTMGITEKQPNFTKAFNDFLATLTFEPTPEEIMSYIYARLHSQKYRDKYFEFLKIDFPKVPLTRDKKLFFRYEKLGARLIDLHLLKEHREDKSIMINGLKGSRLVEKITLEDDVLRLNSDIEISGVTKEIFAYEIGSYKVIDKWLKYRKKDKIELLTDDLIHLKQMIISIKETMRIMVEIDDLPTT